MKASATSIDVLQSLPAVSHVKTKDSKAGIVAYRVKTLKSRVLKSKHKKFNLFYNDVTGTDLSQNMSRVRCLERYVLS